MLNVHLSLNSRAKKFVTSFVYDFSGLIWDSIKSYELFDAVPINSPIGQSRSINMPTGSSKRRANIVPECDGS